MDPYGKVIWRKGHRVCVEPLREPKTAEQVIATDGGPWAVHNVVCAVCGERKAIYDLNLGVFFPCNSCKRKGWVLKQMKTQGGWFHCR